MQVRIDSFGGYSEYDGTVKFYTRVRSLIAKDSLIVDWGCGRGGDTSDLPSLYRSRLKTLNTGEVRVVGVDIDPVASTNPTLHDFYLLNDGKCLDIMSESVDMVICDFVLEHIDSPSEFIAEVTRILKPGGYFCARTTNKWGYVAIASKLIPKSLHARVLSVAQPQRKPEDVFPAPYLINTASDIRRLFSYDFDYCVQYEFAEPAYFGDSRPGLLLGRTLHALLPKHFAPSINVFLRKKNA